jgi:ATP-dependent exoDNAse (exonuclease V) beta subunit
MRRWGYRGECLDECLETAVRETCGPAGLDKRVAWLRKLIDRLGKLQPALMAELRAAADRGELFHEVALGYLDTNGERVEGSIDLLYRGGDGQWRILDYKTSRFETPAALKERLADYYPQVAAYAAATRGHLLSGHRLASYGLWFVVAGITVAWNNCPLLP